MLHDYVLIYKDTMLFPRYNFYISEMVILPKILPQKNKVKRQFAERIYMNCIFKELKDLAETLAAYDVYKHCMYMPTKEKYELRAKAWLQDESVKVYACFDNRNIKGIVVISMQNSQTAEILGISIDSCFRRQGIGSFMIKQVIETHNIVELYAETDDDAVAFYAKNGFKVTAHIKNYGGQSVVRYHCVLKT